MQFLFILKCIISYRQYKLYLVFHCGTLGHALIYCASFVVSVSVPQSVLAYKNRQKLFYLPPFFQSSLEQKSFIKTCSKDA